MAARIFVCFRRMLYIPRMFCIRQAKIIRGRTPASSCGVFFNLEKVKFDDIIRVSWYEKIVGGS
jgi:hypothetical protein